MSTVAEKLNQLIETKNDIQAALIEKGQAVSNVFSSYADKIRAIVTLSEGTADATANAADIISGKVAYSKGVKIVGTAPEVITSTVEVNEGDVSPYAEGTLYIVYEE